MSSTALMIVPQPEPDEPEDILELTGPCGSGSVNHWGGMFGGGEVRPDAPFRPQRCPRPGSGWSINEDNARRILALLDRFTAGDALVMRQIAEIRYRVLLLQPVFS